MDHHQKWCLSNSSIPPYNAQYTNIVVVFRLGKNITIKFSMNKIIFLTYNIMGLDDKAVNC